jgi:formylglycine-generating enzyme required for sulfatase activity
LGSYSRDSYFDDPLFSDHPVIFVNWDDARAFCRWDGARLPTEAEWEKAARGLKGGLYPWGDTFNGYLANFCDKNCDFEWANLEFDDKYADTAPVGSYEPNSYGLYDMAGNVWEWVADWYDVYPGGDPTLNEHFGENFRVARGGSWVNAAQNLRSTGRYGDYSFSAQRSYGFRCARDTAPK